MSRRAKKNLRIALAVFGVAILVLINIVFSMIISVIGNITYLSEEDLEIPEDLDSIVLDDEYEEDNGEASSSDLSDDYMQEIDKEITGVSVDENNLRYEKGVKNILILGIDSRSIKSTKSRSDVMIILTINENTKKIVMSSIMRDIYVNIPGRTKNAKINAACAYGGAALAVKTVESNFGIKIDNFMLVNFYSFMDIVDALGGVDVEINKSEMKYINGYIAEINKKMGHGEKHGQMYMTGSNVHLTGKQAMGYVRVRYSGNADYERTERQREVLEQLIKKARTANYSKLVNILESVTGNIATDMTSSEILGHAANASKYLNYEISQFRIPLDGTQKGATYAGASVLVIDFEKNREALYDAVFGSAEK